MELKFSFKPLGEIMRGSLVDREITMQDLAKKLQLPIEEVEKYERGEIVPDFLTLQKLSGILGIPYSILRISAGYNTTKHYPNYYTPDGQEIDIDALLCKAYYKDPSTLPHLFELAFGKDDPSILTRMREVVETEESEE